MFNQNKSGNAMDFIDTSNSLMVPQALSALNVVGIAFIIASDRSIWQPVETLDESLLALALRILRSDEESQGYSYSVRDE